MLEIKNRHLAGVGPTPNMGHLFVVGEFVVVSHLKIFPLQLPAQAALREKS